MKCYCFSDLQQLFIQDITIHIVYQIIGEDFERGLCKFFATIREDFDGVSVSYCSKHISLKKYYEYKRLNLQINEIRRTI